MLVLCFIYLWKDKFEFFTSLTGTLIVSVRKENEELLNSLNRDISVPENVTAPP